MNCFTGQLKAMARAEVGFFFLYKQRCLLSNLHKQWHPK